MVTAGVFLVCRCSIIYEYAPDAAALVTLVGATTAFFAATVGLLQDDIKKIVAYSTCSQLGFMFFAAGVGAYGAAMFHLFTHAFFKALLFLGSGAVIHGLHHEQDIKKMGAVRALLPATWLMMVIGTIAITGVGIPGVKIGDAPLGTAGFVSKDVILESAFAAGEAGRAFADYAFWLGLTAAVFTAFYSWRLIFLTFHGPSRVPEEVRKHPHAVPTIMLAALVPLAAGALFAGMAFYGDFVGPKADKFWNGAIYSASAGEHGEKAAHGEEHAAPAAEAHGEVATEDHGGEHHVPIWVLWAPFIAMVIGTSAAVFQYLNDNPLRPGVLRPGGMIYGFLKNKWYFDEIYDFLIVKPALWFGRFLWTEGDGKTIDGVGPDGIAGVVSQGAKRIVKVQSGYMYHYAFVMLVGIAALITFIVLRSGGGQ
jgi:NADH-quinone oxidoreductase subunit L